MKHAYLIALLVVVYLPGAGAVEFNTEALKAMQLGERSAAVLHFRRALEHRPLEVESSYWLAHLLSLTGRRWVWPEQQAQ